MNPAQISSSKAIEGRRIGNHLRVARKEEAYIYLKHGGERNGSRRGKA